MEAKHVEMEGINYSKLKRARQSRSNIINQPTAMFPDKTFPDNKKYIFSQKTFLEAEQNFMFHVAALTKSAKTKMFII